MKKISILLVLLFSLFSCWEEKNEEVNENIVWEVKENKDTSNIQTTGEEESKTVEKPKDIHDAMEEFLEKEDSKWITSSIEIDEDESDEEFDEEDEQIKFDCSWAYEEIKKEYRTENIAKFWEDYSKCYFDVNDVWCWSNKENSKIVNYEVILDYSQSMLSKISWETRMSVAKKWLENFLKSVKSDTNVGFVVYWHKWWSDCKDIEELVKIWKNNRDEIVTEMKKYQAKWYTPIAKSLQLAWEKLLQYKWSNYENHILLISDWVESCKWDPIAEVKKLAKQSIIVSIIWFDVNSDASKNLKEIADISWWMYYRANNLEELDKHLKDFDNNHSCYMDKAMNNLDNRLDVMDDHFACSHSLNMEKAWELRDIQLLFDAPEVCKKSLATKTKIRFLRINKKIEDSKKEADKNIDTQESENNNRYIDEEENDDFDDEDEDEDDDEDIDDIKEYFF